jgi:hypothetical protein
MHMHEIDWIAAIVAGVLGYFPGALWYSPLLFLKPWARELNVDLNAPRPKHAGAQIAIGLIPSIAGALVFAGLVGIRPDIYVALHVALALAGGVIATAFAIQYLYEGRGWRFWLINSGYHLLQYLIFALVLSFWP